MFDMTFPGFEELAKRAVRMPDTEIAYATRVAVSRTASAVRADETAEIKRVFDNPVTLTQRAVKMQPIRDRSGGSQCYSYIVKIRDEIAGGTPPARYLYPEIFGGERGLKSFEKRLQREGMLPSDMYAVPGGSAPLDSYGNLSGGRYEQILSALGAAEQFAGYSANRTRRSAKRLGKRRIDYFVAKPGNLAGLAPGVYQRTKTGVKPIVMFVRKPTYKQRFDFFGVAERTIAREWSAQFNRAIHEAFSGQASAAA